MATSDTTSLNLSDQRGPEPGRRMRDALAPFGNGKGEWLWRILTLLGAAFLSYMTASAQIDKRVSVLEERQSNQNAEVIRRLDELKADIREIRK